MPFRRARVPAGRSGGRLPVFAGRRHLLRLFYQSGKFRLQPPFVFEVLYVHWYGASFKVYRILCALSGERLLHLA